MLRSITLALGVLAAGCGTATVPPAAVDVGTRDAGHDAGRDAGHDAGSDAALFDAGADASPLDAIVIDPIDANDLDAGADAFVSVDADAGPFDAAITRTAAPSTHPAATPIAPFTECTVTEFTDTCVTPAEHRAPCTPIAYPYYPPSAGPHYWFWASFLDYASPVPWGFLVHDLEHGAVVLAYHCENDADCAPVRTELAAIVADHGLDPVCRLEDTPTRFILVNDPTLPVPIAAVAWQHLYEATCLDPTSLRAFVDAHYGMGDESLCAAGMDRSDGGWCP